MNRKTQPEIENISTARVVVIVCVAAFFILSLSIGYFLGLAWLLTLLAPLTFPQAVAIGILTVAGGFLILARLPTFDLPMVLLSAFAFAVIALVEVLLARLVAFLTPLAMWEASLLIVATAALLLFIVVQMILDTGGFVEVDSEDDSDDTPYVRRLSPNMYTLRPQVTEESKRKRKRTSRRQSKQESDDADSD